MRSENEGLELVRAKAAEIVRRRRRAVRLRAAAGAAVVVLVVGLAVAQAGDGGGDQVEATAGPTTLATAADPTCPPGAIELSVRTDKARYSLGETVVIDVLATNRSDGPCPNPSFTSIEISGPAGASVFNRSASPGSIEEAPPWRPEEQRSDQLVWEQRTVEGVAVGSGDYTVDARWEATDPSGTPERYTASVTFTVG